MVGDLICLIAKQSSLILLLIQLWSRTVHSYTKEFREFPIILSEPLSESSDVVRIERTVYIDPVVTETSHSFQQICDKLDCDESHALLAFEKALIERLKEQTAEWKLPDATSWLDLAGPILRHNEKIRKENVQSILANQYTFRHAECFSIDHKTPLGADYCKAEKMFEKVFLNESNNTTLQLLEFAETLFNHRMYDYSAALAHHQLQLGWERKSSTEEDNRWEIVSRSALLLAEVSKLKGMLKEGTHYGLIVMLAAQKAGHRSYRPWLHRLRMLLTVPPIPFDYSVAGFYRERLYDELSAFLLDLKRSNITVPLEVGLV